jgi:hypothetical protein
MAPAQSSVSGQILPSRRSHPRPHLNPSRNLSLLRSPSTTQLLPRARKSRLLRERFLARWDYTTIYESALPSKLETAQPTTGMELYQDPVAYPQTKVKLNGNKRRYGGLGAKYGTRTTFGHKVSTPAIWFLRSCELGV